MCLLSIVHSCTRNPRWGDDTQISGPCRPDNIDAFAVSISDCVSDVASWMRSNRLQLNPSETEIMWCATGRRRYQQVTTHVCIVVLSVDGVMDDLVLSVRDLGIFIDADLVMRSHVQRTTSRCFTILCQLRQIRRHVPPATLQTPLVLSRLDYGLRQRCADRSPCLPCTPSAVSTECVGVADLSFTSLRSHHRRAC
jgi:hypothetical protein